MKFEDFVEKQLKKDKKLRELNENKDFQFYCDVANLITEARLHAGLTQAQLAEKIGTKQPSVARIEKGTGLPSLSFLLKIAHALDTHLVAPKFGFMEKHLPVMDTKAVSLNGEDLTHVPEKIIPSLYVYEGGAIVENKHSKTGKASLINKI